MKKQIIAIILATAMILTAFTGCAAGGPGNGTTASTTVATTAPEGTTSAGKEQTTAPATTDATEKETVNTTAPEETTAETSDATAAPSESKPTQNETTPPETEPPATSRPTEPPATEPPATEPPATDPPETKPSHSHNYQKAETVAASCTKDGYTVYKCSCGSSYTDDETPATGHSWSDWTITKEATTSEEGEKSRACSSCGKTETASIDKLAAEHVHQYKEIPRSPTCQHPGYTLYQCDCGYSYEDDFYGKVQEHFMVTYEVVPATPEADGYHTYRCKYAWDGCTETKTLVLKYENREIDIAKLEEYGRQYAETNYDFVPQIGTRAGYYPGDLVSITSMEDGYHEVAESVDSTARQLLAAHGTTYCYLDIEVVHEGGNDYRIWVYYG